VGGKLQNRGGEEELRSSAKVGNKYYTCLPPALVAEARPPIPVYPPDRDLPGVPQRWLRGLEKRERKNTSEGNRREGENGGKNSSKRANAQT